MSNRGSPQVTCGYYESAMLRAMLNFYRIIVGGQSTFFILVVVAGLLSIPNIANSQDYISGFVDQNIITVPIISGRNVLLPAESKRFDISELDFVVLKAKSKIKLIFPDSDCNYSDIDNISVIGLYGGEGVLEFSDYSFNRSIWRHSCNVSYTLNNEDMYSVNVDEKVFGGATTVYITWE
jgi:hypothetical protein